MGAEHSHGAGGWAAAGVSWEEPKPLESQGWEGGWQPAPAKFRARSGKKK